MRRRFVVPAVAAAVTVAVLGVALGAPLVHRQVLPGADGPVDGPVDFFGRGVTWAQGGTLHQGDRTYDVGPGDVTRIAPTSYGVLLQRRDHWVLFDGRRSTPLPGDVEDVAVSQDGRYAAWVDFDGPLRPAGRVAAFQVVDLRSGERVLRTSDGMGGGFGDDLGARYSELQPTVLGFDGGHVYWTDASGHGTRKRWDLRTHETQVVEDADEALDHWAFVPWDPQRGRHVGDPVTGPFGFLSPDEEFRVDEEGYAGRVTVTRASTGSPVPLRHRDRYLWFGGWSDDTTFYGLSRSHREDGYDPAAPDRTRGHLVSCSLPEGTCEELVDLTATRSVVFPGQGETL